MEKIFKNKLVIIISVVVLILIIGGVFYLTCFGSCQKCGKNNQFLKDLPANGQKLRLCNDCYKEWNSFFYGK